MTPVPQTPRFLLNVPLRPLQGQRFQPTGFPDVGAATFDRPVSGGTVPMLLVESQQSVANRLESVCVGPDGGLVAPLAGLPHVRVDDGDEVLTTSILEAHRLNSPYIENAVHEGQKKGFHAKLAEEIGYDPKRPFSVRRLAATVFKYDPNAIVHGVFLESIAGVLRLPRVLSGFVEAYNVAPVAYGGVKNDRVMPSTKDAKVSAKEGYGNVPFHREDFSAETITAYFNVDLTLLRSYGLGEDAERLLFTLSLWKIRKFLEEGLRLRTACDLTIDGEASPDLPTTDELSGALPGLIEACSADFASPRVTVLQRS